MARLIAVSVATAALAAPAEAHWAPQIPHHNARHAVNLAWCGNSNLFCATGYQAWRIAECESHWWPFARNGQYLGMWQFGEWARARYGFGWDPWRQARAAYRYWRDAGWSPWSCSWAA